MIEFDICGTGAWSDHFADCEALFRGLETGNWLESAALQPELIPPRERRRAPQFVKMAIEVMLQACRTAGMDPRRPAAVFASQMSDMDTTDYICRVLAQSPALVSPTRFHNSVHNAAVGYWSIATENRAAANAMAAYEWSVPMALLEAAAQVAAEQTPVLVVAVDAAPPVPFDFICPGASSFAAALLLAPLGSTGRALAHCRLQMGGGVTGWPELPSGLPRGFASNASARILPLLQALGRPAASESRLAFPLNGQMSLDLALRPGGVR
jgi:hypothetical protein